MYRIQKNPVLHYYVPKIITREFRWPSNALKGTRSRDTIQIF
jgi:hypothetical protein